MKRILFATALVVATPTFAADNGFYGAFDIGQGKMSDITDQGVTLSAENTTPFRLGVGYQFNQNFGLEGSYTDFGKSNITASVLGIGLSAGDVKANSTGIAAIAYLPVSDTIELFGKVGYNSTKMTLTPSAVFAAAGATTSSSTKSKAAFGLGVKFNINKQVALRAQYEDFGSFGDTPTTKVTAITIGATYAFQ